MVGLEFIDVADYILGSVLSHHADSLVHEGVMHKGAIDLSEMVLQCPCQCNPNIDNSVRDERKHVVFKVLIEYIFCFVHDLLTHQNEQLASLVGHFVARPEIILNDLDDCLLLVNLVAKFNQNLGESSCSRLTNTSHTVFTKLEEHW